jgi:RNA polymerase sigma-70 factor (ECF subfamily)
MAAVQAASQLSLRRKSPSAVQSFRLLWRLYYRGVLCAVIRLGEVNKIEERHRLFLDATMPHLDAVYSVARHAGISSMQPEDLVQETYLRAFNGFDGHSGQSTRAWLVTICLNVARSEGRRLSRRVLERSLSEREEVVSSEADVFDEVGANLQRDAIAKGLEQLPPEQRLAIVLMDLVGHTAAEVAAMLECPRGTVLARVHRGRRRLAGILAENGVNREMS